ncbi:hypothetical protein PACILC2_31920 [Paenibacillus cisolokensis]|uniref:Uncharacterized protein n=1 Tax=Paenibacillus cisolokensis TaxID=1658519 RepID=A0ABQ4N9I3_9BACL|nr:hypothetical protein PACILC2_31920 [Paenibacillus cisolokensis]
MEVDYEHSRLKAWHDIFPAYGSCGTAVYRFFLVPLFIGFYYSLTDWDGFSLSYDIVGLKTIVRFCKTSDL